MPALTRALVAALAAGLATAGGIGGTAASASTPALHVVRTLPGDYVAPLQFGVGRQVYVADSAASALYRSGRRSPIARGPAPAKKPEDSGDLAGVAVQRGVIAYTTTEADHRNTYLTAMRHGQRLFSADLGAYERRVNPDGAITYGVSDPAAVPKACAKQLAAAHVPLQYTGKKDSHAYAVTGLADGSWLVADAGANDVLHVGPTGGISTFAVLPAQPVTVTKAVAKQVHAPACVGITYAFEAVPTDVEATATGVFISTLPGGVGGLGSVYRTALDGSGATRVATGFPEATNLAVTPDGAIFVVSLGRGIYQPGASGPVEVAKLPGAAAVEWKDGVLYASTAPAVTGGRTAGHVVVLG